MQPQNTFGPASLKKEQKCYNLHVVLLWHWFTIPNTYSIVYIHIYIFIIYLFIDIALHSHYTCLIQSAFINLFWLLVPMLNTSRLRSGALQQRCWSTASKAKRKDRASLCTRSTAYWRRSCYCYLISCVRMLPLSLRTLWGTWELDKISLGECGVLLVTWVRAFWCFSTFAMSAKTLPPYRGECCSFHAGPPACIACSCIIYIYIYLTHTICAVAIDSVLLWYMICISYTSYTYIYICLLSEYVQSSCGVVILGIEQSTCESHFGHRAMFNTFYMDCRPGSTI